jgi:L-amino acid N-acyltransferase YncA
VASASATLAIVQIRFAADDDVVGIHEIYAPVIEETAISFETEVPSYDEIAKRIAETTPRYPWLVAAYNGNVHDRQILGYAYGHRFAPRAAYAWSVETSIYVRDTARGQGVGTMLYGALLTLLEAQGYQQAFAGIALPNPASVGLHEAVGFRHIGTYHDVGFKFDTWHDVGWWQRGLTTNTETPREPVPVDELDPALLEKVLR